MSELFFQPILSGASLRQYGKAKAKKNAERVVLKYLSRQIFPCFFDNLRYEIFYRDQNLVNVQCVDKKMTSFFSSVLIEDPK